MSPTTFLLLLVLITASAAGAQALATRRRRSAVQALARQWDMHYSPRDRFRLAERVGPRLPVPGAANVVVQDLIYGRDHDHYRYLFTAEYTVGVIHGKHRARAVLAVREPRARPATDARPEPLDVELAPEHLPVLDQYRHLAGRQKHQVTNAKARANLSNE